MTDKSGANSLNPIEAFAMYYLQHLMTCVVPKFHRELYSIAYSGVRRIAIAAPRSFAKSSVFSLIYVLYLILMGGRKKIYIFSNTATLAEHWLREIKKELEENKYILANFGSVKTDKWTQDHIICRVGNRKVEVRARGKGAQTRGWRPDTIILDDIDDDDAVRSADRRDKDKNWLDKELINTLEHDGQLIMIGTVIHPLALLVDVMNRDGYEVRKYQAIQPDGTLLWPEKWSKAQLDERKREIGAIAFNSEFMNDPIITENPVVVADWLRYYEDDSKSFEEHKKKGLYTVVAIDPAISRREGSDYTALVTVSATFDKEPKFYIRVGGVKRGHWPLNKQISEMDDMYRKFSAKLMIIETIAYQQALSDEYQLYCEEHYRHPKVKEIKPDKDKERRAHAVAPLFEKGQVYFDKSDIMTGKLIDELLMFPTGDNDDLVDALVMCLGELKKWCKRSQVKKTSKPYIVLPGKRRNSVTGVV